MYDTMSLVIPEDYFSASPEEHPAANQTVPGIWESFLDHTVSADCNPPMGSTQESGGFCGYYTQMLESVEERHCTGTLLPDFAGIQDGEGLCGDVRADPADHEASLPSLKKVQPKRKSTNLNSCSREEDDAETGAPQNSKKRKPRASKDVRELFTLIKNCVMCFCVNERHVLITSFQNTSAEGEKKRAAEEEAEACQTKQG